MAIAEPSLKETIERLVRREDLSLEEAQAAVESVINGANSNQCAAFLVLLRAKGETPREVAGMVMAMRKHMVPVGLSCSTLDIVGTGGDGANTLNFSTAASIVAASCGARVAKVRISAVLRRRASAPRAAHSHPRARAPRTPFCPLAARQPIGVEQEWLSRRLAGARRQARPRARAGVCVRRRGFDLVYVRARLPSGDGSHRASAQGAGRTHGVQHPRPAA